MAAFFKDNEEKRKFLVKRNFNQVKKGTLEDASKVHTVGASHCADKSTAYLKLNGDMIVDITHDSKSCVVTTSATDILMEYVTGINIEEAKIVLENYYNYINGKEYDSNRVKELVVFDAVVEKGNRYKCLELPYTLIKEIIE